MMLPQTQLLEMIVDQSLIDQDTEHMRSGPTLSRFQTFWLELNATQFNAAPRSRGMRVHYPVTEGFPNYDSCCRDFTLSY